MFTSSSNAIENNKDDRMYMEEINDKYKKKPKGIETMEEQTEDTFAIYRFKFTEDFMLELYNFSKIHQYDARKDFKDAWEGWVEDNLGLVDQEQERLENLGYDGNVIEKMFKSARYYFRKKNTVKIEAKGRAKYVSINRDLLNAMDTYVAKDDYQPKTGFIEFCRQNETIVKLSLKEMLERGLEPDTILSKIKKTYNNRYYIFTNRICEEIM